ncbi:hypothetical protein ACU5AY_06445 [Rhizobium sp. PAMB 3174]
MFKFFLGCVALCFQTFFMSVCFAFSADEPRDFEVACAEVKKPASGRVVCADLVAIEQVLVYNRFGSFNPFGTIFALRRDVVPALPGQAKVDAEYCDSLLGTEAPEGDLSPGAVRLKDCKRPRPVTLRVNVGDTLVLQVENLLRGPEAPDFSKDFCGDTTLADEGQRRVRVGVRISGVEEPGERNDLLVRHGEADCREKAQDGAQVAEPGAPDWPSTRLVNLVAQGLHPLVDPETGKVPGACRGLDAVAPGESFTCRYSVDQEGTYFFASMAAPAGGEGDGGSIVHGLFGAVVAERQGSRWYRSQVSRAALDAAWSRSEQAVATVCKDGSAGGLGQAAGGDHVRLGQLSYEATDPCNDDAPILNMARTIGRSQADFDAASHLEIVHTDLNAIIWCNDALPQDRQDCRAPNDSAIPTTEPGYKAFREFSVFFHDELKTFYTRNFHELGQLGQLAGVKDGFAINYGASGMGSLLLANRKGIGPSADCMECLYEEFFLTSWANGDPALLEWYADDPSNVHHSYLNDPVVFRNFHAGPKETHVFHLHAHQWFAGNDPNRGSYLDSQTVGPQQGFTYNIYHGGLRGENGDGKGWWDTQGSGNRNRTVGDSIFHCHLYPHFAQGMWALWRVHDVFEDGTRKLPDGQADAGLSIDFAPRENDDPVMKRAGSVNAATGAWQDAGGTPVPALVPLPGEPLPLLPSYGEGGEVAAADPEVAPMPGYPFYIGGKPGHRPPQAPLDIARNFGPNPDFDKKPDEQIGDGPDSRMPVVDDVWLAAGLNRHVVGDRSVRVTGEKSPKVLDDGTPVKSLTGERKSRFYAQAVAKAFALGDLSGHLEKAEIEPLSPWGTLLERAAMGFHFDGRLSVDGQSSATPLKLEAIDGSLIDGQAQRGTYATARAPRPDSDQPGFDGGFYVNGSAPKPGAPFADPCGTAMAHERVPPKADPFGRGWLEAEDFLHDPKLKGYRRYEVSAVQLDMIVNSAGWHDPQARINVLTAESDDYKDGEKDWRISPVISDSEEPFFFRALSGECIEFRHTNELPKKLELDDFQVKTPTDTIGQHIHLVKFDVTASDGSGNGWNYEDGTFAPDEIAGRLCAWAEGNEAVRENLTAVAQRIRDVIAKEKLDLEPPTDFCTWNVTEAHNLWRLERNRFPFLFQTTTQRWFADPILSADDDGEVDRTMRTVFTHDHFGPSSIQQHGFYSALVVEPPARLEGEVDGEPLVLASDASSWYPRIQPPGEDGEEGRPLPDPVREASVAWGGKAWEGARKRVVTQPNGKAAAKDPTYFQHPNYREFMLSIADFALLYDPRDRESPRLDKIEAQSDEIAGGLEGMEKLYCEAFWRNSPALLETVCGTVPERDTGTTSYYFPNDPPPAFFAAGAYRDDVHRTLYAGDLFEGTHLQTDAPEVVELGEHLTRYRQKAAGTWRPELGTEQNRGMAKPVAGPLRPESISVDHHDPYLVNYRGAPIPLRIGTKNKDGSLSNDCAPRQMNRPGENGPSEVVSSLEAGSFGQCSVAYQRSDDEGGDIGMAFSSRLHGDPETPVLEAFEGERLVLRMIQGAQEVQHMFGIAGQPLRRNIDQHWMRGAQPLGHSAAWDGAPTLQAACLEREVIRLSDPRDYAKWRDTAPDRWAEVGLDEDWWKVYENALETCDNIEGFTYAQEIGISEHFEMQGSLRSDVNLSIEVAPPMPQPGPELPFDEVPRDSSDYFYSYGAADALWNGAWGLVRIFKNEDALDPRTVDYAPGGTGNANGDKIGLRLSKVPTFREGGEEFRAKDKFASRNGLACPVPKADDPQRVVDAVVAAVEMRRVFPAQPGTVYGEHLYDPDGLFLALVAPGALGLAGIEDTGFSDLEADQVIAAIRMAYPVQPEPFVLRVAAGDCLRIRVLNLLGESGGMRDLLGDAIMPRIVPLNTDPTPSVEERPVAEGSSTLQTVGLLDRPAGPAGGVRPSARLALNFGLPGLDLIRDTPHGFGYNADALAGGNGGVTASEVLVAYAGRVRLDLPKEDGINRLIARKLYEQLLGPDYLLDGTLLGWLSDKMREIKAENLDGAKLDSAIRNTLNVVDANEADSLGSILGKPKTIELRASVSESVSASFSAAVTFSPCGQDPCLDDPDELNTVLRELMRLAIRQALDESTHWIPYAFGPAPVRPLADPVGQVPHGLFGVVDVVPTNWRPLGDDGLRCDPVRPDGFRRCTATYVAQTGDGQPMLWAAENKDGGDVRLREFVLFWRDGMNLWDDANAPIWRWSDDDETVVGGNMVPDCIVCDDSYDRGEAGVSHTAPSFSRVLAAIPPHDDLGSDNKILRSDDLNAFHFPADYLVQAPGKLELKAEDGEQIVIRVIHPGGRARQRAFAMNGYSYDDLFPGFGFPRSALLGPGKAVTAWLRPSADTNTGTVVWHDGPTFLRASGTWGLLSVGPVK